MPTANQELRDAAVRHQVYLQRYSTSVVDKMLALINRADIDIIRRLRTRNLPGSRTPRQRARLEKLLAELRNMNRSAFASFSATLRNEMRDLSNYEAQFLTNQINGAIAVSVEATAPALGTVYASALSRPMQGKYLKDWFRSLEVNKGRALSDAIRLGVVEGETISDIVKRIRGTRAAGYRNGVLAIHRRHAEAVTRTAVNHIVTNARQSVFQRNADVVKGWQYVATLDGRTTDICMSLDGQVYATREEGPTPPQHINCRSSITPILKSWKELGFKQKELPAVKRAAMDGRPAKAGDTYQSWLKRQGAQFQNDVLGRAKGALFRRGGLTLDKFVDPTGRSYTLAQLRKRESAAWLRAFGGG